MILLAAGLAGVLYATQDTALTQREVRDPRQLETWLETNAADAETRIAAALAGDIAIARMADALTSAGAIGAGSLNDSSLASAQTVTNNAPILLAGLIVQLDSSGQATALTNAMTLTSIGTGTNGVFHCVNVGSNLLTIVQGGTWKSDTIVVDTNQMFTVIGIASSFYGDE